MSQLDLQWNKLVKRILKHGWDEKPENVRAVYADTKEPAPTRFVIDAEFKFDASKELPIMFGKEVNIVKPIQEIAWIMIDQSNVLADLHARGIHFWDNWESKDPEFKGTIGKAYGYQVGLEVYPYPVDKLDKSKLNPNKKIKLDETGTIAYLNQIDYLIQNLMHSPFSRRHIMTLLNIVDFKDMQLPPCVWRSEWYVDGDMKLNVKVGARSSDVCLGNPFNVTQYYFLLRLICQVTGYEPGFLKFDMGNAHIYDRHIDGAKEIISREEKVKNKQAQLILPPEWKSIYDFDINGIQVVGYDPEPAVKFIIAE